jgi:hypothetical protein
LFTPIQKESYARTGAAGAVGLTGVLYLFLFAGVYFPLFSGDVPLLQAGGFFLIPVIATGSLAYAYLTYDWLATRRARAVKQIEDARATVKSKRASFESRIDEQMFRSLQPVVPEAVERAQTLQNDFLGECQDVDGDCSDAIEQAERTDIERLENIAATLETRAEALSPSEAIAEIETTLEDPLKQAIREELSLDTIARTADTDGNPFQSPYGVRYRIENLPSTYRQVDLPDGETVTFTSKSSGNVGDQLVTLLERGEYSLHDVGEALDTIGTHVHDTLIPHIQRQESEFTEIEAATEEKLDRAEELITEVDGHVGQMLERMLVDGTHAENTDTIADIQTVLSDARDNLHTGDFEEALDGARTAREMAEELLETLQFLRSVFLPDLDAGVEKVEVRALLPDVRDYDFLTPELFEALAEPLRHDYAADIDINADAGVVSVAYLDPDEVENRAPPEKEQVEGGKGPKDSVLYLLREFEHVDGDGEFDDPNVVTLQLASIPDGIIRRDTVPELVEFAKDSATVDIETEQTPDESPPTEGYVALRVTEGERPTRAIRGLREEYRDWANNNGVI